MGSLQDLHRNRSNYQLHIDTTVVVLASEEFLVQIFEPKIRCSIRKNLSEKGFYILYLTLKKTHSESPFERFYREQREKLENEEQSEKFHKHYEENAKSGDKYKKFSTEKDEWAKMREAGGTPRNRSQQKKSFRNKNRVRQKSIFEHVKNTRLHGLENGLFYSQQQTTVSVVKIE